ncbi:insoluble domain protein [Rhodococcus sp. NPDC003318]|uniref:insoluble domain protein n=1 Tax=Rhodococcus sp. NPDC003318 TaxID=3364503 RepID=UPI0036912A0E
MASTGLGVTTLVPVAAGLLVAFAPTAAAAPGDGGGQSGITTAPETGGGQAGITTAPQTGGGQAGITTPAPEPAPVVEAVKPQEEFWVAPPAQYNQGTQPYVEYGNTTYDTEDGNGGGTNSAPPIDWTAPRTPAPVLDPTLPIEAPKDKMRLGRVIFDQPNWISEVDAKRTNNQTAVIEAQTTDFWRSQGFSTDEAARIASAQVGGAAAGALTGATALGAPAAVTGALIGGTIGGITNGAAAATFVQGIGWVAGGTVGTAAGAAIGAAAAGVPAAVIGGVGGGVIGAVAGTVYGGGEGATPIETVVPDVDSAAITEQVVTTLDEWQANPVLAPVAQAAEQVVTVDAPSSTSRCAPSWPVSRAVSRHSAVLTSL